MKIQRTFLTVALLCTCLVENYAQDKRGYSANMLPISTPEAEGVSSAGILKFLDAVDNGKNELHSFVILRHGKIISEGWWSPYGKDFKHVMFSVSKSFTSMGVGLAISENKLKLTDRVVGFFQQSLPGTVSAYMNEMTVQDLLKMSTGMNTDPLFTAWSSRDWPKTFMSTAVENKPGTVFKYNNMASFMLSAIVQKATGEKLVDYLKPRLFDPMGIINYSWDEAPGGYTFGAIGLKLLSEDMAKVGQMLLQKGKWNGRQILPEHWVKEATSAHIMGNVPEIKAPRELNDWEQGYGYQFWRSRNNSFRADGLGGQYIMVLPDKDAVVVLTAGGTDVQEELNLVWEHLLPAMQDKPLPKNNKASAALAKRMAALSTSRILTTNSSALAEKISGKRIEFTQAAFFGVKALSINFQTTEATIQFDRGSEKYSVDAGLEGWTYSQTNSNTLGGPSRADRIPPIPVASKYTWTDPSTMEITSKFVEESIRSEVWVLHFDDNGKVRIEIKTFVEGRGMQTRALEGKIID